MIDTELPARAWIEGYGHRIVPRAPFEIARLREGDRVAFAHHGPDGVRSILVVPADDGADTRLALGSDTSSLGDVLAFFEEAPFEPGWAILTGELRATWPMGSTLWSTPYDVDWAFELTFGQGGDEIVYVQGPFSASACPPLEKLVGEGMHVAERGTLPAVGGSCSWLDLHYVIDAVPWTQRRHLLHLDRDTVVLITAQAPREHAPMVMAGAADLVLTLTRRAD